jgi:hypothetical protein
MHSYLTLLRNELEPPKKHLLSALRFLKPEFQFPFRILPRSLPSLCTSHVPCRLGLQLARLLATEYVLPARSCNGTDSGTADNATSLLELHHWRCVPGRSTNSQQTMQDATPPRAPNFKISRYSRMLAVKKEQLVCFSASNHPLR